MSQLKSKWFGDSEKIVKRIFTDYRECAKNYERTPVLLFNEADAIISKRRDNSSSNVAQTENTIQNFEKVPGRFWCAPFLYCDYKHLINCDLKTTV
jgi:SpoVK/Ycf46/Vps4 family AAA+-type ATPase